MQAHETRPGGRFIAVERGLLDAPHSGDKPPSPGRPTAALFEFAAYHDGEEPLPWLERFLSQWSNNS